MARKNIDLIVVNGYPLPAPDPGFSIYESDFVDSARNSNGAVVGQRVGRPIWKIDGLKWSNLTVEQWKSIKNAIAPFFVLVTFTDDTNTRRTIEMYPGDRKGTPLGVSGTSYTKMKSCGFNLIDCGR